MIIDHKSDLVRYARVSSRCDVESEEIYLALPFFWPILLAILFRFFCHSGLVKSIYHLMNLAYRGKELFLSACGIPDFDHF